MLCSILYLNGNLSNLTPETFTVALKRFIPRRGLIDGSNFVGANRLTMAFFHSKAFLRQVHDCSRDVISVAFYSYELTPFWRTVGSRREVLKVSLEENC
jgi:hypothetical protein